MVTSHDGTTELQYVLGRFSLRQSHVKIAIQDARHLPNTHNTASFTDTTCIILCDRLVCGCLIALDALKLTM